MPQIRKPIPQTSKSKEPDGLLEKLLKLVETVGLEPGDMMGGLGTIAKKGAGKLIKFPFREATKPSNVADTVLREHLFQSSPKLRNEFGLMENVPTQPPLEHDEVRKMLDLLDQKPKK